ncbi:unknown [Clostridium sp. CAG:1013]|nr:unknown [Clostridium sp. CAG:1013]
MVLCLLAPFWEGSKGRTTTGLPWEARKDHTGPKSALCGPVCRPDLRFGPEKTLGCEVPSFPDGKAPGFFALCGPVWPISNPGGETTRHRPFRGDLGPTGASLAERKETASSPGWGRILGCDSQAGERDGAVRRPLPESPRPAEPVVAGFLPSSTDQKIRGRFGGLGVTIGVRNTNFPGGKPFLRVSPPGSTKG